MLFKWFVLIIVIIEIYHLGCFFIYK